MLITNFLLVNIKTKTVSIVCFLEKGRTTNWTAEAQTPDHISHPPGKFTTKSRVFLLFMKGGILSRDAIKTLLKLCSCKQENKKNLHDVLFEGTRCVGSELVSSALQIISAAFYGMIDEIIHQTLKE